jgi:hypothetical protein
MRDLVSLGSLRPATPNQSLDTITPRFSRNSGDVGCKLPHKKHGDPHAEASRACAFLTKLLGIRYRNQAPWVLMLAKFF